MKTTPTCADIIISQLSPQGLGGLRLMTGANKFGTTPNSVRFNFKESPKFNCCEITLDPDDTYTMNLYRATPAGPLIEEKHPGLHCDNLQETFESATGLYLALPRIISGEAR